MKNPNLLNSFNNAIQGILYAVKNERNMKIHIVTAVLVVILSLFYRLQRVEYLMVCLAIGLVIICELFNTAMEAIVDIIVDVYHPKAKVVKDVAAGAVFISACISGIVGYFIFFDRVASDLDIGLKRITYSHAHITLIALMITIALVFIFKIIFRRGSFLSGGMPSGHAAISFSLTTAVSLISKDVKISILCFIIALLVVQSRFEAKIHSIFELIAGSVLGSLITLLLFQLLNK